MNNEMDISEIMLSPEELSVHYLEVKRSSKGPQFVESHSFPKIFYAKRTMRQLLQERTTLCLELGLSSKNARPKSVDIHQVQKVLADVFIDCPDSLSDFGWTILEDRGTIYSFLASEDKFVPLCKACCRTVYTSLRSGSGRIVCSNPTCKIKLLGQYEINTNNRLNKSRSMYSKENVMLGVRKSEVLQQKNQQIQLAIQDRQLIRKAAKRIAN